MVAGEHAAPTAPGAVQPDALAEAAEDAADARPDRRRFVGRVGRAVALAAPLILMFAPSNAYAASASSS
ncbi:MAG: hypothetical protein C4547_03640 [Phycisphaerales bacterium]|nr:MAG: hypothetical protein C4547_03640 [Phycisphaerales bacterium]